MSPIDLVIPLGTGSRYGDDELRICLRSVERHVRCLRRVVVVTCTVPSWLRNVVVVNRGDPLKHNKDGNMINKVLAAIDELGITGRFALCADDNVFMQDVALDEIPMLYNNKVRAEFAVDDRKWHRRMVRTFDFLASRGVELSHNYEVHAPQVFDASVLRDAIRGVDYESDIGYGIYTLFRGLCGETGGVDQRGFKTTHESEADASAPMDRMFAGYNDGAFCNGLRERLFGIFSEKSRYEV